MGDVDASSLGVVGADRGVWLREMVGGRDNVKVAVPNSRIRNHEF